MTTRAATPHDNSDASPAALWEAARCALRWLVDLFGAPSDLAGWGVLAPREKSDLLAWLRPLEALVRALLLIKAAELPAPDKRARPSASPTRRPRRVIEHDPDTPESWRVCFRALPAEPGLASGRANPSPALPGAWPLAERLEAVIRVLEDPTPFARRLAGRLHAATNRISRILRPPLDSRNVPVGRWAGKHAHAQAVMAAAAFDTS